MQNKKTSLLIIFGMVLGLSFVLSAKSASARCDGSCRYNEQCRAGEEESMLDNDACIQQGVQGVCCTVKLPELFGNTTPNADIPLKGAGEACSTNNDCIYGLECSSGKKCVNSPTTNGPYQPATPPAGVTAQPAGPSFFESLFGGGGTPSGGGYGGNLNCELGTYPSNGLCLPETGLSGQPIARILSNLLNWLMGIFAFIAVIAFAVSGIQYLTSAGDEGLLELAKNNMKWSIVGVLVGLSGLVIVRAISAALQGYNPMF